MTLLMYIRQILIIKQFHQYFLQFSKCQYDNSFKNQLKRNLSISTSVLGSLGVFNKDSCIKKVAAAAMELGENR